MPMTVEEYRIAQLYMIQKKSREESTGDESGVEILKNEPYTDGPGGTGQYTFKIYHVGSHLPGWLRSIIPDAALRVEEEAWNAYPYTKTLYKVPFIEKFSLEIETMYLDDAGERENVFNMSSEDLNARIVDYIDIVTDPLAPSKPMEDPSTYVSQVTGRGPLPSNWRAEFQEAMRTGRKYPNQGTKPDATGSVVDQPLPMRIMCSYKKCRVEFRYWGMQSKIESFIQEVALRRTMVNAHRQAWTWQDEWYGLTMKDIRRLEAETAKVLAMKVGRCEPDLVISPPPPSVDENNVFQQTQESQKQQHQAECKDVKKQKIEDKENGDEIAHSLNFGSCLSFASETERASMFQSFHGSDGDDEDFFDARSINTNGEGSTGVCTTTTEGVYFTKPGEVSQSSVLLFVLHGGCLQEKATEESSRQADYSTFKFFLESIVSNVFPGLQSRVITQLVPCPYQSTEALRMLNVLDPSFLESGISGVNKGAMRSIIPIGNIPILLTTSPHYPHEINLLAQLLNERYVEFRNSMDGIHFSGNVFIVADCVGSIMLYDLLVLSNPSFKRSNTFTNMVNIHKQEVREGPSLLFDVQDVFLLGSPLGLLLSLRRQLGLNTPYHVDSQIVPARPNCEQIFNIFSLADPFAYRLEPLLDSSFERIPVVHLPANSAASRSPDQWQRLRECLSMEAFYRTNVSSSITVLSTSHKSDPRDSSCQKQSSNTPTPSFSDGAEDQISGQCTWWGQSRIDVGLHCPEAVQNILSRALPPLVHSSYWESKDASFFIVWQLAERLHGNTVIHPNPPVEPIDGVCLADDGLCDSRIQTNDDEPNSLFRTCNSSPSMNGNTVSGFSRQFRNSISNRLRFKTKVTEKAKTNNPNHRGNDAIVLEGQPQIITARFTFGALDLSSMANEEASLVVEIFYRPQSVISSKAMPLERLGTQMTDSNGRLSFQIPDVQRLPVGLHRFQLLPSVMIDSEDQGVELTLAVVPPNCNVVICSIDGSFAASLSLMGKLAERLHGNTVIHPNPPVEPIDGVCLADDGLCDSRIQTNDDEPNSLFRTCNSSPSMNGNTVSGFSRQFRNSISNRLRFKTKVTEKAKTNNPNHRGNDAIVLEGQPQIITARFTFGALDLSSMANEEASLVVEIFYRPQSVISSKAMPLERLGTQMTDSNGRLSFQIPDVQRLPVGLHRFQLLPSVMIDSEDQGVELTLAVVPPNCNVVICSIDGSFAASLSLMGKVEIFYRPQSVISSKAMPLERLGTQMTDSNGRLSFQIPDVQRLPVGLHRFQLLPSVMIDSEDQGVELTLAVVPPNCNVVICSIDGSFAASLSLMGKDPKVRAGSVDIMRHWHALGYLLIYISARPDMQHRQVVAWLAQHNFPPGLTFFLDGIFTDPLRQKALLLKSLIEQNKLYVHCAYGSAKDIPIYRSLGLKAHQIFAVGKLSRRQTMEATPIREGYASHFKELMDQQRLSVPATGPLSAAVLRDAAEFFTSAPAPVQPAVFFDLPENICGSDLCAGTTDQVFREKVEKLAAQALDRAEEIKKLTSKSKIPTVRSPLPHPPGPPGSRGNYTTEELKVLRKTSKINGREYLPFLDAIDSRERFAFPRPFTDSQGLLALSSKQQSSFVKWVRPSDFQNDPTMIVAVSCFPIRQTCVTDCSFVASMAVAAQYERQFKKRLITNIIYPQKRNGEPVYNPCGKYMVKLHLNGVPRKIIIDDFLPMGQHDELLCSFSTNKNELWVSLLEKAYMKVMGGYDFPGSNSNIDLHALTGWIPERVSIKGGSNDFDPDKEFRRLETRFHQGHCLVTVATGMLTPEVEERSGLVPTHAYALLDLRQVNNTRLFLLKNPWSKTRWKGNFSSQDTKNWTPEMQKALNYDLNSAQYVDNGVFWIDYKSFLYFFDVFYINWNPELFPYTTCIHSEWSASEGPKKDVYSFANNPQYTLQVQAKSQAPVWVLLTRHITNKNDFAHNNEFIGLVVYKDIPGRKVYHPNDPVPMKDSVRINSPHCLIQLVQEAGTVTYTLVVSQYEKNVTIQYTLRAYSTAPMRFSPIVDPYDVTKTATGEWKGDTAAGCQNYPNFDKNPTFEVEWPNNEPDNQVLVEVRGPREFAIGFTLDAVSVTNLAPLNAARSFSTGNYRRGYTMLETSGLSGGKYKLTIATFEPKQEGPFIISVKSTRPLKLTRRR
nr:calpain (C02 family) [Hymenolepis microstoma]